MSKRKLKTEREISLRRLSQLSDFLFAVFGDNHPLIEQVAQEPWRNLKLELKRLDEQNARLTVKLKMEESEPDEAALRISSVSGTASVLSGSREDQESSRRSDDSELDSLGSYSSLKKTMKRSYGELKRCAKTNTLPNADVVEQFLLQSKQMVQYPNRGEELYVEYGDACATLEDAFNRRDVTLFSSTVAVIESIKKEAHRRYK